MGVGWLVDGGVIGIGEYMGFPKLGMLLLLTDLALQ